MSNDELTPARKAWIAEFEEFIKEFKEESDRAAVILGAAHIDSYLRQLLESYLLPVTSGQDELLDGDSPLATFSARINMCYRLGLITADFAKMLHLVRKIRNSFAHEISGVTLNTGSHRDRIRDLVKPLVGNWGYKSIVEVEFNNSNTPATEFRAAIALLTIRLKGAVDKVVTVDVGGATKPFPPAKQV